MTAALRQNDDKTPPWIDWTAKVHAASIQTKSNGASIPALHRTFSRANPMAQYSRVIEHNANSFLVEKSAPKNAVMPSARGQPA